MTLLFDGLFLDRQPSGISRDSNEILQLIKKKDINFQVTRTIDQSQLEANNYLLNHSRRTYSIASMALNKPIVIHDHSYRFTLNTHLHSVRLQGTAKTFTRIHDFFPLKYPLFFPSVSRRIYELSLRSFISNRDIGLANSKYTISEARKYGIKNRFLLLHCEGSLASSGYCGVCEICNDKDIEAPSNGFFCSVGTIEPRKNYLSLIKFWQQYAIKQQLWIFGKPGWFKSHSSSVSSLAGRTANIRIFNNVCDAGLKKVLSNSNGLISVSLDEGFNLPNLEALRLNIPLILNRNPLNEELYFINALWIRDDFSNLNQVLESALQRQSDAKSIESYVHAFDRNRLEQFDQFLGVLND